MELKPGTKIKNYVLERQLGAGASGEVWKASDGVKSVALKLMNEHLLKSANAQKHRMRLEREIEALRRLNHPNIPELYEYDLDFERPYLVMRYIGGDSYEKLIANGRLMRISLQRRIDIIGEIAMALRVAHEAGIIHRDLKPANITGTENPYLLDFSVALDEDSIEKTGAGIGTALYMAVDGPPDTLNDIFGFVLVSYEIIFGRHAIFAPGDPLARGPMAALEALNRIKARTWFMPSTLSRDQLPPELLNVDLKRLDEVFQKGLGERAKRYTDPRDFARDLREVLTAQQRPAASEPEDHESRALPIPKLEAAPPPAAKAPPPVEPPPAAKPPPPPVSPPVSKEPDKTEMWEVPVTPPPATPSPPAAKQYEKTEMFEAPVTPPPASSSPPASKDYEKTEMWEVPVTPPPAAPSPPAVKQYEKTEMFEAPVTPPSASPSPPAAKQYEKTEMFETPVTPPAASHDPRRYEKTEMFEAPAHPPPAARDPRLYEKTAMFDVSGVMPAAPESHAQQAVAPEQAPVVVKTEGKKGGRSPLLIVLSLIAAVVVIAGVLILSQGGLGGAAPAEPTIAQEPTTDGAAVALDATATPEPTDAPTEAPTEAPTDAPTVAPTATPRPSNTPRPPTNTPVLPTTEGTPRPFTALTRYEQCFRADVDRSGRVDETDLAFVSESIGERASDAAFEPANDVDGNGSVETADVDVVLVHLGRDCLETLCEQLDVNQDGRIDNADLDALRGALGGVRGTDRYSEALDFNADGVIDAVDIERLTENLNRDCSQ